MHFINFFTKKKNNKSEESFHDEWASATRLEDIDPKAQFECQTSPEYGYAAQLLAPIQERKLLILGCGLGEEAVYFAQQGAIIFVVDISQNMLTFTKKLAMRYDVQKKINFFHTTIEDMHFPENFFDAVFACNVLHHVDLKIGIKKIYHILKKDGVFVFLEPLAYNPVINIYRAMASRVRTDNEHPITLEDMRVIKKYFPRLHRKEFHLFTLLIFIWFFIGERVHPNKERYWKKIIHDEKKYKRIFPLLYAMDTYVLKYIPFLSRYCWIMVADAKKDHTNSSSICLE